MSELQLIIEPDEEELEAAEILVDGKIGGRSCRFLLDTGAAQTRVALDDYTSAFTSSRKSSSSGVFAAGSEDLIEVPSLELGPISRKDFTVVRAAHGASRYLIGMDLLNDLSCHFRFDEGRLVFSDIDLPSDVVLHELFLDRRHHPYVNVGVGTTTARAVWDTGAGLTVVDRNLVRSMPAAFREERVSTGEDSTGAKMETRTFTMAETTIGGFRFPSHRVAEVDLSSVNATIEVPMDMILGYSTLRFANWLFDFPGRRWAVTRRLPQAR